tara:strand:+ start:1163 stop:1819 length:657 start_codon:yes stop_codon:yes gene_type:complete
VIKNESLVPGSALILFVCLSCFVGLLVCCPGSMNLATMRDTAIVASMLNRVTMKDICLPADSFQLREFQTFSNGDVLRQTGATSIGLRLQALLPTESISSEELDKIKPLLLYSTNRMVLNNRTNALVDELWSNVTTANSGEALRRAFSSIFASFYDHDMILEAHAACCGDTVEDFSPKIKVNEGTNSYTFNLFSLMSAPARKRLEKQDVYKSVPGMIK